VVWKDTDGDIVGVTGEGAYASPAVVERVADSVVDTSQPVDLFLTVTPEDWSLHTYLSDQYVTYGRIGELSVTLLDRSVLDLGLTGAEGVRSVTVDGRPAQIGQVNDERGNRWVLQSTAPDGQGFHLETPTSLTSDQVIAIAAGVRHR
jgi:hypothetical protein